ncbi:hypothetical protein HYR54_03915 [Candidatus Acetothermia bacterium]|nr:hypothetical protein [Candidatus Acetothermia bacterium]
MMIVNFELTILRTPRLQGEGSSVKVHPVMTQMAVDPDDFLTAVFVVSNLSNERRSYQLEATVPGGWEIVNLPKTLELDKQSQQELFLTVQAPPATKAGDYSLNLSAKSESDHALGRMQLQVRSVERVKLILPTWQPLIQAGEEKSYPITVTNRGNLRTNVSLVVIAPWGWQTRLPAYNSALAPGQSQSVELFIKPPEKTSASQTKITVQVTSAKVQEEASFTIVVSPR